LVVFELRILFGSNEEQDDSSRQGESAKSWWNRHALVFFGGGVDRADIEDFLLVSVTEALIGEPECAQNY